MDNHFLYLLVVVFLLGACDQQDKSPSELYLDYHARSAEGMSFEEDAAYYSSSRIAEINDKLAAMVTRSGKTRDEAIRLYLDISRRTASCSSLSLIEEEVSDSSASLVFDATATCGAESADSSQHKVTLVMEDGWKLVDVEIAL